VGLSSVSTLIDALKNPIVIHGARSREFLLYRKRYRNMILTTDDGSFGRKGFVTDALEEELKKKKYSMVYTCGPEMMMKKVVDLCNAYHVECEASLERFMKCGFGICGNCMVDDTILCIDGPIFDKKTLNSLKEFGHVARLKTGRKVTLKEYYGWRS
jgi:dihydroorotate dehydrogenase electron transfer subunit